MNANVITAQEEVSGATPRSMVKTWWWTWKLKREFLKMMLARLIGWSFYMNYNGFFFHIWSFTDLVVFVPSVFGAISRGESVFKLYTEKAHSKNAGFNMLGSCPNPASVGKAVITIFRRGPTTKLQYSLLEWAWGGAKWYCGWNPAPVEVGSLSHYL